MRPANVRNGIKLFILMLLFLASTGCRQNGEKPEQERKTENDTVPASQVNLQEFSSTKWGINFEFPQDYEVYEGKVLGERPIINIYEEDLKEEPPLIIHEDLSLAYIAILPMGYGVDAPSGKRKSFLEWEGSLPLSFDINESESTVYLLENDEPWAYSLRFFSSPGSWTDEGFIFIRMRINNVNIECEGEDGNEKPVENCDPLMGDKMKYYGEVDENSERELLSIIENLYFFEENPFRDPIEDMIHVKKPEQNGVVNSPLNISGEAKGYWFFEGVAPVKLVDRNYKELASGTVKATGDWMTDEFVSFEGNLEFSTEGKRSGILIFNKSNPSGKPEHARSLRVPVKFSSN